MRNVSRLFQVHQERLQHDWGVWGGGSVVLGKIRGEGRARGQLYETAPARVVPRAQRATELWFYFHVLTPELPHCHGAPFKHPTFKWVTVRSLNITLLLCSPPLGGKNGAGGGKAETYLIYCMRRNFKLDFSPLNLIETQLLP